MMDTCWDVLNLRLVNADEYLLINARATGRKYLVKNPDLLRSARERSVELEFDSSGSRDRMSVSPHAVIESSNL